MSKQIIAYAQAMKNYEKAIKRLKKSSTRFSYMKQRMTDLERLVVDTSCKYGINDCIEKCPLNHYQMHAEARAIRARWSLNEKNV